MVRTTKGQRSDTCISCLLYISKSNTFAYANAQKWRLCWPSFPLHIDESKWVEQRKTWSNLKPNNGNPFIFAEPYTEYRIIVIAFTLKYDGEPSEPIIQKTDIAGPSAPSIINLTCHSQDALYLQWKRPSNFYNTIDFYMINYKEIAYSSYQQIQLNTSASYPETAVSLLIFRSLLNSTIIMYEIYW